MQVDRSFDEHGILSQEIESFPGSESKFVTDYTPIGVVPFQTGLSRSDDEDWALTTDLDYDENANQAMNREIYEETGLDIPGRRFIPYFVNSNPKENRQNVTIRFYCILKSDITEWCNFSKEKMEKDEVSDIKWIKVKDIENYQWAFNHNELINYTYNTFVNISWWKRVIINWYNTHIIRQLVESLYKK